MNVRLRRRRRGKRSDLRLITGNSWAKRIRMKTHLISANFPEVSHGLPVDKTEVDGELRQANG